MNINRVCEIEIPSVPNFIRTKAGETISISELTEADLKEIGKKWTEKLVKRAVEILKQK